MREVLTSSAPVRWAILLLLGAGALLLAAAWWMGEADEPPGWTRLDAQLAAVLGGQEPDAMIVESGAGKDHGLAAHSAATLESKTLPDKAQQEAAQPEASMPLPETASADGKGAAQAQLSDESGSQRGEDEESCQTSSPRGEGIAASACVTETMTDALGRLNINLAGVEELDSLPGIGPAKARAIVEDRSRNGRFQTVEELTRVKGIGPKMLEKIKNSIVVVP